MHKKDPKFCDWCLSDTHLSHIFEVVVSFLQGPGSVQGLAHAGVFAEEGFAVVLDPVYHLDKAKTHRSLLIWTDDWSSSFLFFFTGQRYKTSQGSWIKNKGDETSMICRGNLGQRSADDEDLVRETVRTPNRGDVNGDENTIKNCGNTFRYWLRPEILFPRSADRASDSH